VGEIAIDETRMDASSEIQQRRGANSPRRELGRGESQWVNLRNFGLGGLRIGER